MIDKIKAIFLSIFKPKDKVIEKEETHSLGRERGAYKDWLKKKGDW